MIFSVSGAESIELLFRSLPSLVDRGIYLNDKKGVGTDMHCRLFRSLKKRRKNKDGLLFCGSCCFSLVMYLKINNVSIRERKKREKAMKKGEVKLSRLGD